MEKTSSQESVNAPPGKATLKMLKGKSMNTSVPSIAIRYLANDEELEQLYLSDNENEKETSITPEPKDDTKTEKIKRESSPMKDVFSKLGKRSASIDSNISQSESPTPDRWRLFSEIKGKLTKTVEEKISEIKSGSKIEKEDIEIAREKFSASKENSSISDSEDASGSENSKFADAEVSYTGTEDEIETSKDIDNDIFSLTEDQMFNDEIIITMPKKANIKLGNVQYKNPNKGMDSSVETAVEAIEVDETVNEMDEKVVVKESAWKLFSLLSYNEVVIGGMVWMFCLIFSLTSLPSYVVGVVMAGFVLLISKWYSNQEYENKYSKFLQHKDNLLNRKQIKIARPYKSPIKYEAWMNEYQGKYDVHSYHIRATHCVYVKLEGSTLTLSSTNSTRIPKRSMWNEKLQNIDKIKFTHHRIFNMAEARIKLLPEGLARKRYWSKKYPICLEFLRQSDEIDDNILPRDPEDSLIITQNDDNPKVMEVDGSNQSSPVKKPPTPTILNTNCDFQVNEKEEGNEEDDETSVEWDTVEDAFDGVQRLYLFTRTDRSKEEWFHHFVAATHHEIESRTPNIETISNEAFETEEKEETKSTPTHASFIPKINGEDGEPNLQFEYEKFVKRMQLADNLEETKEDDESQKQMPSEVIWINALFSRVMLDAVHQPNWVESLQQRLQRKLSVIRLPYFIEELTITELNLGTSVPTIHKISNPFFDDKGIWIDFDITYEGSLHGTLVTKLNLMKLKKQTLEGEDLDKTAEPMPEPAYDSDLDDSAESSSEDDVTPANWFSNTPKNTSTSQVPPGGNTTGKKFLKMVDKFAATPFFQQATDYTFIKKGLEKVSKTELKLRVELQGLVGVLTVNIPPPPSHRIWVGFRGNPQMLLNAEPIVGVRALNFNHITSWIEKKLQQEFQKLFVLPNMEDFVIPMMNLKLPE